MDPSDYAREIERYLCRKNEGRLVRIVGPAFEQVCGWAQQGVPLKVAFRGIDQYCERYYAKGPKRRPVRIEFCEADILDLFDAWRRAVGVAPVGTAEGAAPAEEPRSRKPPLAAHVERAIARLVHARERQDDPALLAALDAHVRELEALLDEARSARGDRRSALLERLERLDASLMTAARASVGPAAADRLKREAEEELAAFAPRMSAEARTSAVAAATDRLLRESLGLPTLRYE